MIQDASVPFQLADGTAVILRPVACSDREYFRVGFRSMSPGSRYYRFFAYVPGLSDTQLQYFTEVDQINHVAWVAMAAERTLDAGLGVARFVRIREQPEIAEFSFAVIDSMQRQGLGRALLAVLHLLAAESGVKVLRATCLPENERVVTWLCRLGAEYRGYSEGTFELDLHVGKGPDSSAPCGSASHRFANVLDYLGRALAEARENLRSPAGLSFCTSNKNPTPSSSARTQTGALQQYEAKP